MSGIRNLAAMLVVDIDGHSRLAGADEVRMLARLPAVRSDFIDPIVSVDRGRIEFRSVVGAVSCAVEEQNGDLIGFGRVAEQ
jgi:adenylate cyclase